MNRTHRRLLTLAIIWFPSTFALAAFLLGLYVKAVDLRPLQTFIFWYVIVWIVVSFVLALALRLSRKDF